MSSGTGYRPQSYLPDGLARMLETLRSDVEKLKRYRAPVINQDEQDPEEIVLAGSKPQLLVLTASGDSIAAGGDHVTFGTVLDRQGGFSATAAGSSWTHPTTATYVLTYEHAWTSFTGGADVDLEIDGITAPARRIGTGTAWQFGRGTIHYYAEEGTVGRIKVTHSDGSAQVCDATMWLSVSDPLATVTGHTAELYINDALVAWTDDTLTANHTGATTLLVGELSNTATASEIAYDDVSVVLGGAELVGNGGFESALAGTSSAKPVTTGNWWVYDPGSSSGVRVASPAHAGSQAFEVTATAGSGNGCYALQDMTMPEGDAFELEFWCYPASGEQYVELAFDWNRTSSAAQTVAVVVSTSSVDASAFGVSLPSVSGLAAGAWSHVRLVVNAQEV